MRKEKEINVVGILNSDGWEKRHESICRVHGVDGIAPTIPTAQGGGVMTKIMIPEATEQGFAVAVEGDSINLSQPNSKTRRGRVGVANTIDTQMQQYTPVCVQKSELRLQGTLTEKGYIPTLKSETKKGDTEGLIKTRMQIRRLTPVECERLQGFPDEWTRYGHDGKEISDSQRYKMMGNSVSVPVVKAVMERLFGANKGVKP